MKKIISALLLCLMCSAASAATYKWTGAAVKGSKKSWTNSGNWVTVTIENGMETTAPTTNTPGATDDVIIPAGCDFYPVLAGGEKCNYIYFDIRYTNCAETMNSARIKNQHLLDYKKAFCDVTITANRWVRVSPPLKNTFSGDYFVKHQTLDQRAWGGYEYDAQGAAVTDAELPEDWHFAESAYKYSEKGDHATNENLYVNRSNKGTYYSYYSSNRIMKDDLGSDSTTTFVQQWGDPSNSLKTHIQPAMGFDVWVNYGSAAAYKDGKVTFRFPSATTWYAYFEDGGHISPRDGETYDRSATAGQGQLSLDKSKMKDGKANFTVTREGGGRHSKMFAVGNPAVAYLDIARFIHTNVDLGHIYRYVYTHVEEYAKRGTEIIYFYSRYAGDQLYKLTTGVKHTEPVATGNTNPNGGATTTAKSEILKATRPSFINPAEGFRVFGGGVSYKCAEPDLVGIYSSARVVIAPDVCAKYYSNGSLITGENAYSSVEIPMLQKGYVDFDYSVTVTDYPEKVRINNFLNLGSVVATIDTENKTLTIPAGSKIMAVLGGENKCTGSSDADLWNFTETGSSTDLVASNYNLNAGSVTTSSKTFNASDFNNNSRTATNDPITITFSGGSLSTQFRVSANTTMKVTSSNNPIVKVVMTFSASRYMGNWSANSGNIATSTRNNYTCTWTGSSNELTLTTSSDARITKVEVQYDNNPTKIRVLNIYGLNADRWYFGEEHEVYSGVKANNITNAVGTSSDYDIVLKYSIDAGAVHIDMSPTNCKKILVRSDAVTNNPASKPAYIHDTNYPESRLCEAWFAFEGMNSEKPADSGTDFIMAGMSMEGSYGTRTYDGSQGFSNLTNHNANSGPGDWYDGIEIARIAGRTNVVSIKGLYPGDKTTLALGQIEHRGEEEFKKSDFSENTNKRASKNGVTIDLSSAPGNNSYIQVSQNNTIKVSSDAIIRRIKINTNQSNPGTWTALNGEFASVGDVWTVWQGKATSITLTQTSSTAARVTSIEVTYLDENGSELYLIVPAGQSVHVVNTDGTPAPELDSYFYAHGNAAVRMRTIEMKWHSSDSHYDTNNGYWETVSLSDSKGCQGTMVTRLGLQPDGSVTGTVGAVLADDKPIYGNDRYGKHRCALHRKNGTASSDNWDATEDFSENDYSTSSFIDLTFTPDMFQANMEDALTEGALAPARVAASAGQAPVIITAAADDMVVNTMIEVNPEASDAFNPMEDAPLFDVADYNFSFGTLAGSYLVGVNSIAYAELIPLYLSQSATLTFENIATLGEAYLYDAVAETRTLITNDTPYALAVEEGQQAGRYFIETSLEAPEQTTDVENISTEGYSWKPVAYCPAKGALAVACADEAVRFEVFNISGQKVGQSAESTTFSGLQNGVYVVNAVRGSENQSIKVIVY